MALKDFPNQQQVVQLLQRSLDRGRLAHGYLFAGDDLTELEAVARNLAKALNCPQAPLKGATGIGLDACDQCINCRRIASGNHPDIQWVRPESKSRIITIDQVRDLLHVVHMKPSEASYKVAVIVAADRLNVQAANAFLKTLEEPPSHSILILLSADPCRMLETILSRCLRLTFAGGGDVRLSEGDASWLEGFTATAAQPAKTLLGRYKLLGAMLARLNAAREEVEAAVTARSPLEKYSKMEIDSALEKKWEEELQAAVEAEYRRRRAELLTLLQGWFRDVWMLTIAPGSSMLTFPQFAGSSRLAAGRLDVDRALVNLEVLEKAQRLLSTNVQEALALEVSFLKLQL